jgi:hypothetical protein
MTDKLSNDAVNLKKAGVSLPVNPERANAEAAKTADNIKSGEALDAVKRSISKVGSSVGFAMDKKREPLQSLTNKGIPHTIEKTKDREKVRQWTRGFYANHNLMSTAIDIYTKFPIQGIEVVSKDPEIKRFYEALFFDQLGYGDEGFLEDFGREFWTVGEVNCLANWNKTLGIWDKEQIINPNDVVVMPNSIFSDTPQYFMRIPETVKNIIKTQTPRWEYNLLLKEFPDIVAATLNESAHPGLGLNNVDEQFDTRGLLSVSPYVLSRTLNKVTPWDSYGTPHMMRAFGSLIMEESLNAAQDAVADRLYSPMILAKLGAEKLGDGEPWIPSSEELDEFTSNMQAAFAADFRFLAYHFGIDIHSVFGKESLPDFSKDYERLERKMLQVWGIGEALISGSNSGTYASSALNREFVTQKKIQSHFKKRCEIVAEAQQHFDYEISNGVKTPIMEEVLMKDPETGQEYIKTRPKLLIPELSFATLNLRDEKEERTFLQKLKAMGVPVSDKSLMVNIELEFKDELEQSKDEFIQKGVFEARAQKELYDVLVAQGLPVKPDLLAAVHPEQAPSPMGGGGGMDSGNDLFGGGTSGPGPRGAKPTDGIDEENGQSKFQSLPKNQAEGNDRPPESDEQKGDMPRRISSLASGPSVIGARNKLSANEIRDAIINRAWTRSITEKPQIGEENG